MKQEKICFCNTSCIIFANTIHSLMSKNKRKNLAEYLLTLQLLEGGYCMTWDELVEMNIARVYLTKGHVTDGMYISQDSASAWYKKSVDIVMKSMRISEKHAKLEVAMLGMDFGLNER